MIKNFFITAWRSLIANKIYTSLNIAGLALGVAVCLLIGVWLQRELNFDTFYPNGDQIFRLANTFKSESESFSQAPSGPAFGAQLPRKLPAVKAACRLFRNSARIKVGNEQFMEREVMMVDPNFFQFFRFRLKQGQPDQVLNNFNQVVLTEKVATSYFGNQNAIGKAVLIDGKYPMTVSGVVENPPINSHIQFNVLFSSLFIKKRALEEWKMDLDNLWVGGWPYTYVQLLNPADWQQAEKQINQIAAINSKKEWRENKMSYHYFLQPLRDIHLKSNLRYDAANNGSLSRVNVFSVVGIIVLLLACINYINLTTAGAVKRAKETAVRKVIGAVKSQLVGQFFLETLIVCSVAVSLGLLVVNMTLPWISQWLGQTYSFPMTGSTIFVVFATILFISIISGIYPAIILTSFNPATTLKGNFLSSVQGNWIRKGLVVFQFTITIALVSSILIISQQMKLIKEKSLGYDQEALLEIDYSYDPAVVRNYATVRQELLNHPHIRSVSRHNQNIVGGLGNGWTTTETLAGEEISTSLYQSSVDTSYFKTYNMKLAAGRFFSKAFPTDTAKSVLVNEAAVRTFGWKKPENAIGKRFGKGQDARYVVGVVKDFNFENLHKPVEALLIHNTSHGGSLALKIDAAHAHDVIRYVEATWKTLVPDVPLHYYFVDERVIEQYGNEQKMEEVFYGFAGLSLLIACLGLFGLSMFVVERKIKEIGIRKVLGASVSSIVSLLSRDFLTLIIISLFIATPVAWYFMNQWLDDFAYRIQIKPWVFGLAGLVAILIALITVSFQSIKAALVNPVKSLRSE